MFEVKHGSVTVLIPDELALPEKAGNMSPDEVSRIPKPPHGIGLACAQAADAITKSEGAFTLPSGVTAQKLIAAGEKAEAIDDTILDMEIVLAKLKQGNLIVDADAWEMLRKVNDQVKAQGKYHPELLSKFGAVTEYFDKGPRKPKAE